MVSGSPLVSVIIVNHNGIDFVDGCLRSVLNNAYPDFEVIFVDNASSDGSLEYVKKAFAGDKRLKFVENSASLGPAVGRNRGAAAASGKYLVFLDNDTRVEKNWITELVTVFERDNSIGSGQSKLLRMDSNLYDCAGDYLGPLGFLIERSKGAQDQGQFDSISEILSAKSAASIIRKDIFARIGGFDEDFYMYLEETDLSWRVWLSGYRVVFIPASVVYHAFNTPKKDMKKYYDRAVVRYYGCRNYISTLIKNLGARNLIRILPIHVSAWVVMALLFALKAKLMDSFYIFKGISWNIIHAGALIRKRAAINKNIRAMPDSVIFKKIKSGESLRDYFRKISSYLNAGLA